MSKPTIFTHPPKLWDHNTTPSIFWSPRWQSPDKDRRGNPSCQGGCNSYVLLATDPRRGYMSSPFLLGDQRVLLVSINGAGDIRWDVSPSRVKRTREHVQADPSYVLRPWNDPDGVEGWLAFKHFGLTLEDL